MDKFKVQCGVSRVYNVSIDNFIAATGEKEPFVGEKPGGEFSCYAVCPACENPIQLIGLYKNTVEGGKKPYGRHNKGSVPRLAVYNEADYLDCLYSNPNKKNTNLYRSPDSGIPKKVVELLFSQFDRIIYILSKDIDMRISYETARRMLEIYMANEGYRYRVATLYNIPWVLGEVQRALPMFGRKILKDSELHRQLKDKVKDIDFVEKDTDKYVQVRHKQGSYLDLHFLICNHNHHKNGEDEDKENMQETVDLWVFQGSSTNIETVYRKTIVINTDYFINLVLKEDAYRNMELLKIAAEVKSKTGKVAAMKSTFGVIPSDADLNKAKDGRLS